VKILKLTQLKTINQPVHHIKWPVPNVLAYTSTRHSPNFYTKNTHFSFSEAVSSFRYFNLGLHVGDKTETVIKNREMLLTFLPEKAQIQWLEQVHSADVLIIDKHNEKALIADAAITRKKSIALAIMTADCLPILLTAKDGSEIAAIHAGWKPLVKNIIANTVNKMDTANENIIAWLGPCIGQQAFEVGEEVKLAFVNQAEKFSSAFTLYTSKDHLSNAKSVQGITKVKYLADLPFIAKLQLAALGISELHHLDHCTYSDEEQYFSYRREKVTGRMASIICRL
jgi:YfiH family protein